MATIKKGVPLVLGVITAPVSVVSATKRAESLSLICNQGHKPTKTRQNLFCPECQSTNRGAFVKGKAMGDTVIVVDEQQLAAVEAPDTVKKTITVTCHPANQLGDTLPGEKAYFLKPDAGAEQAYPLLVELVRSRPDVAYVTEWAARTAATFYRLQVFGDVLTLVELARPDTIADTPDVPATTIDPQMLQLAETIVAQITTDYDRDAYRDKRAELIEALITGGDATAVAVTTPAQTPSDLMAMLQAAVQKAA